MARNSTRGKAPKRASDHIPFCGDQGLEYLIAGANANLTVFATQVTLAAGAATINFQTTFGKNMANASYFVIGTAGDASAVGWSSKTATSVQIDGTGTATVDVLIIGRSEDQPAP